MAEKKNILLVDDDEDITEILQDLLSEDYHISLAGNGMEAWEIIQKNKPDLMITDLKMPHMDGRELVKKLRDGGFVFPVVVISGAAFDPDYLKSAGINHVLTKPFNQFDLDEICRRFLDS